MILEFELEERTGNKKETSYLIKRKGLPIGSLILDKQYKQLELKEMTIK